MEADGQEVTSENAGLWNAGHSTQTRQQFIALINTVGSVHHARRLMKHVIIPRKPGELDNVPRAILDAWALRAADGEEVPPKIEAAVKKRLMGWEEWANREVISSYRDAAVATAESAASQKLPAEKQVQLKYLADGIAMMTRDTGTAFGVVKPTQSMAFNQLVINAGPPRRLRVPKVTTVEAEVRELTSGDALDPVL